MLERLLLLSALAGLVVVGMVTAHAWSRRQTRQLRSGPASALWEALGERPDGRPVIVAFSTNGCAACRTAQAPALRAVELSLGPSSVRIVRVDAAARPDVVKAFGVMTVPSTAVFGADGQLSAYNRGFAAADRLVDQIETGSVRRNSLGGQVRTLM
jgi:thiol:disulfide interchange protein